MYTQVFLQFSYSSITRGDPSRSFILPEHVSCDFPEVQPDNWTPYFCYYSHLSAIDTYQSR